MKQAKLQTEKALDFIVAGKAIFTIRNTKSGGRFTYKVAAPKDKSKEATNILWVCVLTGENNESDYHFIGCLRQWEGKWTYSVSPKSRIGAEAPSQIAFAHVFNNIISIRRNHAALEIWHEGICCRCGRKLTVPESIESGIGPECAGIKERQKKIA